MASGLYNSFLRDVATGAVDLDTDTFYAMLVTSAYTFDKDAHNRRDDITNEVTGTGYTADGKVVTVTVAAQDNTNDRVVATIAAHNWPTATITARGEVFYKRRGGAASADEIVGYNDFGSDISSTADTFSVAASTITYQN